MRLIADGVVDRDGVSTLAASLGYSSRQLGRILTAELGAGPLALARAHRAHTARTLLVDGLAPLMNPSDPAGSRSWPGRLDRAILEDLGYQVDPSWAPPQ